MNSSNKPVVAIDFDDTWTLVPDALLSLAIMLRLDGGTALIVSCRPDDDENRADIMAATGFERWQVLLTSGSPKRWYAEQRGWKVDIWIDDMPETIINGR